MDPVNVFIAILFLLIIIFIGLVRAESLFGVLCCFFLLTFVAYIVLYQFKAT